jgi:hypothetical protein
LHKEPGSIEARNERSHAAPVIADDIQTLLSVWTKERRAKGGWWALAGFSFQSTFYLLRFFEGLQDGTKSPADLAKTELISDILIPKDGTFTLIQVKRTLDRPKLAAALREAYEIAKLCDAGFLSKLRFKIACLECSTPAVPKDFTVEEIVGAAGDLGTWTRLLKCFDVEDAIIEEPDPLDHLHDFLWHVGIRDAVGFVDNCLGILLRLFAYPSRESISQIAWELSRAFHLARDAGPGLTERAGLALRRDDVELDSRANTDRGILFNRRPQLRDLQLGRVRQRPTIFSALIKKFDPWWHEVKSTEEVSRIPVMWIDGRSGEGKSVLLLQLAQRILTDTHSPVLSYLSSADELPGWIENQRDIRRDHANLGWLPAIAVVDDLHFMRDRDEWENKLRAATDLIPPRVAVLGCGPTLEREKFESDFSTFFEVCSFSIPNLARAEMEAFGDWFANRTGEQVKLDRTDPANRMLVIWVFELLQGESLLNFAGNFKRRLVALDLFDLARTILAANALEMPAPAGLFESLSDNQRDTFQALCSASQLHFERIDAGIEAFEGYRLSHPQIDWQLYREWVSPPATLAQHWGRDLALSLIAAAKDCDWAYANEFIYGLSTSSKLSEGIVDNLHTGIGTIDQALTELYRKQAQELSPHEAMRQLPRWLEVMFRGLSTNLDPDPIQQAVQLASVEPQPSELPSAVAGWLWRLSEINAYRHRTNELRAAAQSIIFGASEKRLIGSTLSIIASKSIDRAAGMQLSKRWLETNAVNPEARLTIGTLLGGWPQDDAIAVAAQHWLDGNLTHPQAYQLLETLVAARPADDNVAGLALKWLEDNPKHPQAYHVIAPLVAARPADDKVAEIALSWVEDNPTHHELYWPLSALVAARSADDKVVGVALRWLEDNPKHPQAYHLIAPLVAARPADDNLAGVAFLCVEDNSKHQPANELLRASVAAGAAHDDNVVGVALEWIEDNPKHPQAYQLVAPLVAARPADDNVVGVALKWIEDNPKHPQAYQLVAPLVAARPADDNVVGVALKWIEDNPKHPQAHELLRALVAARAADDTVAGIARTWLVDNPNDPHAYILLSTLIARSSGAGEWMQKGKEALLSTSEAGKRSLLAALLSASKADKHHVDLTLDAISAESDKGNRIFLLVSLGRALANNIQNSLSFLAGQSTPEYRQAAAEALARALRKYPNRAQEFLELSHTAPVEHVGLLLSACIDSEVPEDVLNTVLRRWLNDHQYARGYGAVLRKLKQHPTRWQALSGFGDLSLAVKIDYRNQ